MESSNTRREVHTEDESKSQNANSGLMPQYKINFDHVDLDRLALLVVDMENDFLAAGAPLEVAAGRAMVPSLRRVIEFCRDRHIRVIYTTHVHRRDGSDMGLFKLNPLIAGGRALREGTPGVEIYPDIAPRSDELAIRKHRFSAFYGTDLELVLPGRGWTRSSSAASRPRTAATPPRGTPCSGTSR